MQFLQFLCLATQEDFKNASLFTMLPMIIIFTSMLGQVEEIISGLMVNTKALMPYFCVYFTGTKCTNIVVLDFHYSTFGIINCMIILLSIYIYFVTIAIMIFERRSKAIAL